MSGRAGQYVYIVDDEPRVRTALCKTLERAGLSVRCFDSANDCLANLGSGKCDLLITDVRMPEKDGIELLVEARKLQPWLTVLVITGFGDVPMAVKAMKAGAGDFIEKPLDRDTFLEVVRTLLARQTPAQTLVDHTLTRMELKVLCHILSGRNNREIADVLSRSPRTVEVHRRHLMQKLGANNVVELLHRAAALHLFDRESPGCGAGEEASHTGDLSEPSDQGR